MIFSNFVQDRPDQTDRLTRELQSEGYHVTVYHDGFDGNHVVPDSATLAHFVSAAKAGVFIMSSHATSPDDPGMLVETYSDQAQQDRAFKKYNREPRYHGLLINGQLGIWIRPEGIKKFFADSPSHDAKQLVFAGTCWSINYAPDFGAAAYFGYTAPVFNDEVYHDWHLLFDRLTGAGDGARDRDTASAWAAGGYTDRQPPRHSTLPPTELKYRSGLPGGLSLSPAISKIDYPGGLDYAVTSTSGKIVVHFDTDMDTGTKASSVVQATSAQVEDAKWVSPTELSFTLRRTNCTDSCSAGAYLDATAACSAGSFHNQLDGDTNPGGDSAGTPGIAPNGDNQDIPFRFAVFVVEPNDDTTPNDTLDAVAAFSPKNAWAVGQHPVDNATYHGLIEHWNGQRWSPMSDPYTGPGNDTLTGISRAGNSDLVAVGYVDIPAAGADKLAAATEDAVVERRSGGVWSVDTLQHGDALRLDAVSADSADDAWAVGETSSAANGQHLAVAHETAAGWSVTQLPFGTSTELIYFTDVVAVNPHDVWAVGVQGAGTSQEPLLLHYDGHTWSDQSVLPQGGGELTAVAASGPNDVWAVGVQYTASGSDLYVLHFNGTKWSTDPQANGVSGELDAVAVAGPHDAWALGGGIAAHWDGTQWTPVSAPTLFPAGATALADGTTWSVGTAESPGPTAMGLQPEG